MKRLLCLLISLMLTGIACAKSYVLKDGSDVIGEHFSTYPKSGENLIQTGRRYDVGYDEMIHANPSINPAVVLSPNTRILIPDQHILPAGKREGIVINLAEYRLYYYPKNESVVISLPVGIGREGWKTPLGETHITTREMDPKWRPTPNVRVEAAKHGMPIPAVFPPGVNNPLGRHILRLGWPTYLIHGTNRPEGVGARVSAGCLRMLPEDIEWLYQQVSVGTPVRVVNDAVKMASDGDTLLVEIHPLLTDHATEGLKSQLSQLLQQYNLSNLINDPRLLQVIEHPDGQIHRLSGSGFP